MNTRNDGRTWFRLKNRLQKSMISILFTDKSYFESNSAKFWPEIMIYACGNMQVTSKLLFGKSANKHVTSQKEMVFIYQKKGETYTIM